ncbi:DNA-binding protein, partial [Phytophthora megakarya]
RVEGYADADIADVVRTVVSDHGRRALPSDFPSVTWIAMFKRENDFMDVDDLVRGRSRTTSGKLPSQRQQQENYIRSYELEQQQYELEAQQHRGDQLRYRNYRQPAAPPPMHSPIPSRDSFSWEDANDLDGGDNAQQQRLRYYQPKNARNFHRSPSAGSSNDRSGHSESNASDQYYRKSNLVPAKVWDAAMEDVAIRGMSLRNAAKAHGVHFAALHRRLKKRQQQKLNMPCEPNYIPFEDEAGVVRVIHARADMGVLLTFTELVDLLKRTALKHHPDLPDDIANALVCKFQSRVEQSVRHLITDWPNTVLYRLRATSDDDKNEMTTNVAADPGKSRLPSIISESVGERGSMSSTGSCSSLSPHPQSIPAFPVMHKSPVGAAPPPIWSNNKDNDSNGSNGTTVESGSSNNNGENENTAAATVSPTDESETNPPCVIFRL